MIVFFCFGKREVVVGGAIHDHKEELLVKAQLGVVVNVIRVDEN